MNHPTPLSVWRTSSCCTWPLYHRKLSYISQLLLLLFIYHRALTVNSFLIHWWSLVSPLTHHCFCTDNISEVNLELWWSVLPWYKPPTQIPCVPCHFTFILPVLWTLNSAFLQPVLFREAIELSAPFVNNHPQITDLPGQEDKKMRKEKKKFYKEKWCYCYIAISNPKNVEKA